MAGNEPDNKVESLDTQTATKVKDTEANKEASAGKTELADKQKGEIDYLKKGGRS